MYTTPFSSFIAAGFECTTALAENRRRLDLMSATKHDEYCREDYRLLKSIGITTVREGLSWSQIDRSVGKTNTYDFSRYAKMMELGREENIQQIWDLNHFDYPKDVDPFSEEFVTRYATYARACIRLLRQHRRDDNETLFIVPMNEISFFAWIGADMGWWAPYKKGRKNGFKFKSQLVRTAITAMEAIWEEDRNVRFIQVDPFMRRLATEPVSKLARTHVREFNEIIRFEAWDMLCGKSHPELGGNSKYLDIIGVNYYVHNQEWVHSEKDGQKDHLRHQLMDWDSSDRVPFWQMLRDIYNRYQRPLFVSETGSFGEQRERWWRRILQEIDGGIQRGLPIYGACIYPTVDRPESAGFLLPNSGIWDFDCNDETCQRLPHQPAIDIIKEYAQRSTALSRQS